MPTCLACGRLTTQTAAACEHCGALIPRSAIDNAALADRIRKLLADGRKIEAIKELREATGAGLAEAKAAVEVIERDDVTEVGVPIAGSAPRDDGNRHDLEQRLLRLFKEKGKIAAIKLFREQTSCGLREAKEYVERLAARHGVVAPQSGCLGVALGVMIAFIVTATCAARAFSDDAAFKATTSTGEKATEGWIIHTVESEFQAEPTEIRVLLPDKLDSAQRHPVLYVLPVEAARESKYGDGLAELKRGDLHNKHGLICVAPTFAHLPWYADHPTDKTIRQESYFVKVVIPFIDRTYPSLAKQEGRWLLGFSKSGWGAWSLLARHPDLFGRAAAWDAPLDMQRFDLYGAAQVFGTQEHFEQYRVLPALTKSPALAAPPPRLVLTGYDNFRTHHETAHRLLDEAQIPHVYRDGPKLKHVWNSGWIEEAVELLAGLVVRGSPDPAHASTEGLP